MFVDSYRLLDAIQDKLSTTLTSFPFLDGNGMEDDLFIKELPYPKGKCQSIEFFYEPTKVGRFDYFSTLKQSYKI